MWCCANCFGDSFLNSHIPKISTHSGVCSFCSSTDKPLIRPNDLLDYFQSVSSIYSVSSDAEANLLAEWFKSDWSIFRRLDHIKAQALLGEILNDGEVVRKKYVPLNFNIRAAVDKWDLFRDEIKCRNRFFVKHDLDLKRLQELFNAYLESNGSLLQNLIYRARVQTDNQEITIDEMGMPLAIYSKNGRANPIGIPYFYAASNPETAIAETRPHPGDLVFVASFEMIRPLRLLDLQDPRNIVSPFIVEEGELLELRHDLDFLCHLGSELSKPILPRIADLEYLPTQYLCEFIKNCEYDGVLFRSSLSDGTNLVLFNDAGLRPAILYKYMVDTVSYTQTCMANV